MPSEWKYGGALVVTSMGPDNDPAPQRCQCGATMKWIPELKIYECTEYYDCPYAFMGG